MDMLPLKAVSVSPQASAGGASSGAGLLGAAPDAPGPGFQAALGEALEDGDAGGALDSALAASMWRILGIVPPAVSSTGPGLVSGQPLPSALPAGQPLAALNTGQAADGRVRQPVPEGALPAAQAALLAPAAAPVPDARAGMTQTPAGSVSAPGPAAAQPATGALDAEILTQLLSPATPPAPPGGEARAALAALLARVEPLRQTTADSRPSSSAAPLEALGAAANAPLQGGGRTSPVQLAIPVPVSQPGWEDEVGGRVLWMVRHNVQAADIRMNPPHLGPIEVRLSLSNDQVSVAFHAHHALVRDALDNALPRLRDMLAENGFNLADADVNQHNLARHQPDSGGRGNHPDSADFDAPAAGEDDGAVAVSTLATALPGPAAGLGLVDDYA